MAASRRLPPARRVCLALGLVAWLAFAGTGAARAQATDAADLEARAQAALLGMDFSTVDAFVEFVKNPSALDILAGAANTITGPPLAGIALDKKKLEAAVAQGDISIYRIESVATVGQMNKTVTAIWSTLVVPQNVREDVRARAGGMNRGGWEASRK